MNGYFQGSSIIFVIKLYILNYYLSSDTNFDWLHISVVTYEPVHMVWTDVHWSVNQSK